MVWDTARIQVRANAHGGVQLRLDAIDALETHYTPRSSPHPWRQNPALGDGASTALLDLLGFTGVTRNAGGIVTDATPPARPGAILTRFADKYGRAVAFAFPDGRQPDGADGGQVRLDPDGLAASVIFWICSSIVFRLGSAENPTRGKARTATMATVRLMSELYREGRDDARGDMANPERKVGGANCNHPHPRPCARGSPSALRRPDVRLEVGDRRFLADAVVQVEDVPPTAAGVQALPHGRFHLGRGAGSQHFFVHVPLKR